MRKGVWFVFSVVILLVGVNAPARASAAKPAAKEIKQEGQEMIKKNKKILVVYYSHSGNTKEVAEQIHKQVGGQIFEIQPVDAYPSEYNEVTAQAKKEINAGYQPAIAGKVENMAAYDVVFIGSPIWWGTVAPVVNTFLSQYDLSGKTVVPFVTHGGGGASRSLADIKKAAPKAVVLGGKSFYGTRVSGFHEEIAQWAAGVVK